MSALISSSSLIRNRILYLTVKINKKILIYGSKSYRINYIKTRISLKDLMNSINSKIIMQIKKKTKIRYMKESLYPLNTNSRNS
jgi:hypothetical protein